VQVTLPKAPGSRPVPWRDEVSGRRGMTDPGQHDRQRRPRLRPGQRDVALSDPCRRRRAVIRPTEAVPGGRPVVAEPARRAERTALHLAEARRLPDVQREACSAHCQGWARRTSPVIWGGPRRGLFLRAGWRTARTPGQETDRWAVESADGRRGEDSSTRSSPTISRRWRPAALRPRCAAGRSSRAGRRAGGVLPRSGPLRRPVSPLRAERSASSAVAPTR
jgi:hypothetical protein